MVTRACVESDQLGTQIILPDFILPSRVNQHWQYSGMDSLEKCLDKNWFRQYPHRVEYHYNSRGFRDAEWPDSIEELKNSIWCVGDSFTVGLGSPLENTWVYQLQKVSKRRTINISLDGASNNWISRKIVDILQKISPRHIVVQWSYITRREYSKEYAHNRLWYNFYQDIKDPQWPQCDCLLDFDQLPDYIKTEILTVHGGIPTVSDEERRCFYDPQDLVNGYDVDNTIQCINSIIQSTQDCKILHSSIPNFASNVDALKIADYLEQNNLNYFAVEQLDHARDYHHYDKLTSEFFVNQIINYLD